MQFELRCIRCCCHLKSSRRKDGGRHRACQLLVKDSFEFLGNCKRHCCLKDCAAIWVEEAKWNSPWGRVRWAPFPNPTATKHSRQESLGQRLSRARSSLHLF